MTVPHRIRNTHTNCKFQTRTRSTFFLLFLLSNAILVSYPLSLSFPPILSCLTFINFVIKNLTPIRSARPLEQRGSSNNSIYDSLVTFLGPLAYNRKGEKISGHSVARCRCVWNIYKDRDKFSRRGIVEMHSTINPPSYGMKNEHPSVLFLN